MKDCINQALSEVMVNDCCGYFQYMSSNIKTCAAGIPYIHQ